MRFRKAAAGRAVIGRVVIGRVAIGAALIALLAGCGGAPAPTTSTPTPAPTPSVATTAPSPAESTPPVTPSASAEPTPTPTPEPSWQDPDPEKWKLVLDTDFDGSKLPKKWEYRLTDVYDAGGRWCSAPVKKNVEFNDGVARLAMSKAGKKVTARVTAAAKQKQGKAGEKRVGCPEGVYDNAMISTQDRFSIDTGMVAARVKFPVGQGAHAGVWLQSYQNQELDIIETYGLGRGVTNVVHIKGKKKPAAGSDAYVAAETVADPAWWDAWHVVSLEWTRSKIVFRLDGEVTRELKQKSSAADYFIVLSLLSSDWETYRLTEPGVREGSGVDPALLQPAALPFGMEVDWVRAWERR